MTAEADGAPVLATPPRPASPLPFWKLLKLASTNTVAVFDEALFDELFIARRYLTQPVFFVSDPDGIKRILVDNFDNYPRLTPIRRLFAVELGTGTLASEGEIWRRHRRVAAPTLEPGAITRDMPAMIALSEAMADDLDADAGAAPVDLERWVARLTLRLWSEVATGGDPDVLPMLDHLSKIPRKPRVRDFVPKPAWLERMLPKDEPRLHSDGFHAQLDRLIAQRGDEAYDGPHDLFWRLARGKDPQTRERLPLSEASDEAASLTAGGAAPIRALTWVWYLLALHPEVERRLHAEVDAVLGGQPPTAELLPKLVYTRQVLDETMRLYPPIPAMLREATSEDVVCGRRIPRGAIMMIAPWVVHRHRKLWNDPERFDPDRFSSKAKSARLRFAYLPFAVGPRTCIAASFAITEMMMMLTVMARRFRFRLDPDHPIRPLGRITVKPEGGLRVIVERR